MGALAYLRDLDPALDSGLVTRGFLSSVLPRLSSPKSLLLVGLSDGLPE